MYFNVGIPIHFMGGDWFMRNLKFIIIFKFLFNRTFYSHKYTPLSYLTQLYLQPLAV